MILGCHLSIGKGFTGAIDAAEGLGNNALQIFLHSALSRRMTVSDVLRPQNSQTMSLCDCNIKKTW